MSDSSSDRLKAYLNKINDSEEDRCWFCCKSPDQIRAEYFEYMKNPTKEFEEIDLDDLMIMTYKTLKPICAACYFAIKRNPVLVKEILDKPEDEVW